MSQLLKGSKPFLNLFVVQESQTVKTKGFYSKDAMTLPKIIACLKASTERLPVAVR